MIHINKRVEELKHTVSHVLAEKANHDNYLGETNNVVTLSEFFHIFNL